MRVRGARPQSLAWPSTNLFQPFRERPHYLRGLFFIRIIMARRTEDHGWWRKALMRRTKGFCQSTTKSPSCFTHEAFNAESNADLQAILCLCLCRICVECGRFLCCIHFADMCSIQCREMNKCVARKARIADHTAIIMAMAASRPSGGKTQGSSRTDSDCDTNAATADSGENEVRRGGI